MLKLSNDPESAVTITNCNGDTFNIGSLSDWRFSNNVNGTLTSSSVYNTYSNSSLFNNSINTWNDLCSKSLYQEEVLDVIAQKPLEDMALLLNDKDPIVRKLAELRLAAGK